MANLRRLMGLAGAIAAGEFGPTGELRAYEGEMPKHGAEIIAKMCAANTLLGTTQVDGMARASGMKWTPFHGWALSGGDYSVCVLGNIGVFVETARADFNEVYRILGQEAHIPLRAA